MGMIDRLDAFAGRPFIALARALRWVLLVAGHVDAADHPAADHAADRQPGPDPAVGQRLVEVEHVVLGLGASYLWMVWVIADLKLIVAAPPDMLVQARTAIVIGRLLYIVNIVGQLPTIATGTNTFPAWTLAWDVGLLVGSYLMYLPAGLGGRRRATARARRWARALGQSIAPAPMPA